MDLDDLTPTRGGSLRGALRPATREPVATLTPTRTLHPDQIWSPRSREIHGHRPWRPGSQADHREPKHAERTPHVEAARMVRAALRSET
jgi:hypothetical protein